MCYIDHSMKFSVIIPLYNKAPYVAKAINSVLAQTYKDFELIVVDDGSEDNSANIAEQTIEGKVNCRLLRQENLGVSVARNNGVASSCGDYLCFLDADDWWEPAFLEEMSELIKEFPDAGIYGTNYTIVNETKHKTRVAKIGVNEGFKKGYINYCKVYVLTMYMPLTSISVALPRSVFDEAGGFPKGIALGEDFMLWIQIALKYKVAFLNKPLAYYNQDVDVTNRGTNHLQRPEAHMLWNLGFLDEEEKTNPDYKKLIDMLRVDGLFYHYLTPEYHELAKKELLKVDWDKQSDKVRRQYHRPLPLSRLIVAVKRYGSRIKRWL